MLAHLIFVEFILQPEGAYQPVDKEGNHTAFTIILKNPILSVAHIYHYEKTCASCEYSLRSPLKGI